MDYYEELGIDRTAAEEEIARAHRRLAKLLHPDQQTDEAVKQLAETQMRRLNSIVETLSDPQRRQEYDEQLRGGSPAFQVSRFRRRAFHSWPWWLASTVGAVVLTVGVVWFSADKWGSSFGDHTPTYIPSGAETSSGTDPNPPVTPAVPAHVAAPNAAPAVAQEQAPLPISRTVAKVSEPVRPNPPSKPTVVVAEVPHHKTLDMPLTVLSARPAPVGVSLPAAPAVSNSGPEKVDVASIPLGTLPAAPKPPEATQTKASYTDPKAHDALEGEWVYAPTEPEKRKAGFYPPEFIDLKFWNQDGLHGEYRARYHVTDKPIAPDVSFALAADGNPRHFTWVSSNGSKGTFQISSMDPGSIKIEWRTTVFSHGPALTAGTATLVRRSN